MSGHRRFRAPTGHGEILADPNFDAIPELVAGNRRKLNRDDVVIGGMPLRELRNLARREALEVAQSPGTALLGFPPDAPLILAGHQPELSHPGVWVKNFALNGLARKLGGVGLNLIVDNDTLKSTSLRFPVCDDDDPNSVHLESLAFDRLEGEVPYERRPVLDVDLFLTFASRSHRLWKNWSYEPLLMKKWEMKSELIGQSFTNMRTGCEREWGGANLELSISRLACSKAFLTFAAHILDDLPRFTHVYNSSIRDYRKTNDIRSANHPAPELASHEPPFWEITGDGMRRPAMMSHDRTPAHIRPRALTLTLFARLCLGDFFIHGIGGGKYDEVTDAIIRDYFGVEPPAYQVLSATLHLPLAGFASTDADVKCAERRVRDLMWNPQRHIASPSAEVQSLLAEKATLSANEPQDPTARREWFRALQRVTERLRPHVAVQVPEAERELARIRSEADANAILKRRDYSWVLYPEATLRPFLQQFLDV